MTNSNPQSPAPSDIEKRINLVISQLVNDALRDMSVMGKVVAKANLYALITDIAEAALPNHKTDTSATRAALDSGRGFDAEKLIVEGYNQAIDDTRARFNKLIKKDRV